MSRIIESACSCGETVLIEIDSKQTCRADKKMPHHPGADAYTTTFRCHACGGWLGDTCDEAAFVGESREGEPA